MGVGLSNVFVGYGEATANVMSVAVTQPSNRTTTGSSSWTITPSGGVSPYTYTAGALTKPAGSAATVAGGTTSTPSVTLDAHGRYWGIGHLDAAGTITVKAHRILQAVRT